MTGSFKFCLNMMRCHKTMGFQMPKNSYKAIIMSVKCSNWILVHVCFSWQSNPRIYILQFVIFLISGFFRFPPECESGSRAWVVLWTAEGTVVRHLAGNCEYFTLSKRISSSSSDTHWLMIIDDIIKLVGNHYIDNPRHFHQDHQDDPQQHGG